MTRRAFDGSESASQVTLFWWAPVIFSALRHDFDIAGEYVECATVDRADVHLGQSQTASPEVTVILRKTASEQDADLSDKLARRSPTPTPNSAAPNWLSASRTSPGGGRRARTATSRSGRSLPGRPCAVPLSQRPRGTRDRHQGTRARSAPRGRRYRRSSLGGAAARAMPALARRKLNSRRTAARPPESCQRVGRDRSVVL